MNGHQLAMALRAAYFAMHRQTDAVLAKLGLTADQFVVLSSLGHVTAITQKELANRAYTDQNTLRPMLVLLESKGLLERRPHPTDGRARGVHMTPKGKKLLEKLWKATDSVRDRILEAVTPEDPARLIEQLRNIVAGLEKLEGRPPLGHKSRPSREAIMKAVAETLN